MRKMRNLLLLVVLTCVGIIGGCRPSTFFVMTPQPMQTGSQDFECEDGPACLGKIIITIEFTKDLDKTSILAGFNVTVILDEEGTPLTFTFALDGAPDELVLTLDQTRTEFCTIVGGCHFTLRLLGSGTSPIRDTDGIALDGDVDGEEGGDYETTFLILD